MAATTKTGRGSGSPFKGERAVEFGREGAATRWSKTPAGETVIDRLVKAWPRVTPAQKARIKALFDLPQGGASA